VLHLARGIAFGVDVGYFLEFERAFESYRVMDAPAQIKEVVIFRIVLRDLLDLLLEA